MGYVFDIGKFDLDVILRDAAIDVSFRPTMRMLANASIGVEPFDAYYSTRELLEALQDVVQDISGAKLRMMQILSSDGDDYQRCLYYVLAGRGDVQAIEDLEWLRDILEARYEISTKILQQDQKISALENPYASFYSSRPVSGRDVDFSKDESWYLNRESGGMSDE